MYKIYISTAHIFAGGTREREPGIDIYFFTMIGADVPGPNKVWAPTHLQQGTQTTEAPLLYGLAASP